jgi:hypothetical protein
MGRVYGWEGAWLTYSVTVADKGEFWSLPLVDTPYNGTQPFLAIKEGEIAILTTDENETSKESLFNSINEIEKRTTKNRDVYFKVCNSDNKKIQYFDNQTEDLGSKLSSGSINQYLNDPHDVLTYMKNEIMGKPSYIFSQTETRPISILKRL